MKNGLKYLLAGAVIGAAAAIYGYRKYCDSYELMEDEMIVGEADSDEEDDFEPIAEPADEFDFIIEADEE